MPLVGSRDISQLASESPVMPGLDTEPLELPGAQLLQLLYEIDDSGMTTLIPPALHPTIPPTVFITVMKAPESPWGPFALAEVRIGCRSGARPRALLYRAVCNSAEAAEGLGERWGYPLVMGEVSLERGYDRVHATAATPGDGLVLDATLRNPDPIGNGDLQYISSLHLARVRRDGEDVVRLIQVDPDYAVSKADRGRPELAACRLGAFGLEGAEISYAVSASAATVNITLPALRYLVDPNKPPLHSVERI
ncbi:MAG TPA: acetoacetate decarboxylase family protein [Tepidiformaceae bacterium]